MQLQSGIFPVHPDDFPRVVQVWEASVRATHHFVSEADIEIFRPLVRAGLPQIASQLACVRDGDDQVAGFVAVNHGKVAALFIQPTARRQGAGKRLLDYAVSVFGATSLDVNEQNVQAVGFYLHMGFEVVGRSELDGTGKPYPLLHMRRMICGEKPGKKQALELAGLRPSQLVGSRVDSYGVPACRISSGR